jgi:hypothetical protein
MLKFNASVFSYEVLVGFGVMGISVVLPGGDFIDEGLFIGNAAVETLGGQDAKFGFGQIEPAAVLGRVVPFEALDSRRASEAGKAA